MDNPWKEIKLDDYENHMSLDSVKQLQAMNEIGYFKTLYKKEDLPNGKALVRLDFSKEP